MPGEELSPEMRQALAMALMAPLMVGQTRPPVDASPKVFADWYAKNKQPSNMYVLGGLGAHTDWDKFVANQRPSENVIGPEVFEQPVTPQEHQRKRDAWIAENPGWKFLQEPIRKDPAKVNRLMREMRQISADPFGRNHGGES